MCNVNSTIPTNVVYELQCWLILVENITCSQSWAMCDLDNKISDKSAKLMVCGESCGWNKLYTGPGLLGIDASAVPKSGMPLYITTFCK